MGDLKVCFVGIGSIAKRHIRNLHAVCINRGIEIQIDAYRRNRTLIEGICEAYDSVDMMPDDYDVIFITNPTGMHYESLKRFHGKGKHFFIEKPVVSPEQIELAKAFQTRKDSVYYVAAPLRYNAVIQWIRNNVDPTEVISVRSISSSYLPDWRPGQDYRQTYSAHKDMGGGVSIDLIHEWDYLTYLFGWPEKVFHLFGKHSDLEIDSDDHALYIADYADKTVELHLDYYGRKTIRQIQLFTRKDTIIGDIVENRVCNLVSGKTKDFNEERDDYQRRELEHFLDMVMGRTLAEDGFAHGLRVLRLTQGE